jgi:hypothetical protein
LSVDGIHVEPDPAKRAALAAIRKLRSGGHSLRAVAGVLNESGHRARRDTQWRLESVVRAISMTVRTRGRDWHKCLAVISLAYAQLVGILFGGLGRSTNEGRQRN